jgi:hypothetical protein
MSDDIKAILEKLKEVCERAPGKGAGFEDPFDLVLLEVARTALPALVEAVESAYATADFLDEQGEGNTAGLIRNRLSRALAPLKELLENDHGQDVP